MTTLEENQEFLAHFGVKGMKWGQRKDRSPEGRAQAKADKKAAKADAKAEKTARKIEKQRRRNNIKIAVGVAGIGIAGVSYIISSRKGLIPGVLPKESVAKGRDALMNGDLIARAERARRAAAPSVGTKISAGDYRKLQETAGSLTKPLGPITAAELARIRLSAGG